MKKFIKFICPVLMAVYGSTACTGNFEEYNTDPYQIYTATPELLLPTMIEGMMYVQQNDSQMVDQMVGTLGGYFTLANRWGGQNFDTFNASDGWNATPYNTMFEDVYANYFDIQKSTGGSGHYFAMATLIRAAVMIRVADCYGPIPYSQVADGSFYVAYDAAEDVYEQIIADLTNSATILFNYAAAYPSSRPIQGNDPIYNGDYTMWARLANSLALRVAVRTGNQAAAEAACVHAAGLIEANAQNALVNPGVQGNPYRLASASWGEIRANSSIVNYMNGYNDPRRDAYFLASAFPGGGYVGVRSGVANFEKGDYNDYSLPNVASESHLPVFMAAETNFLRAEMALKGWSAGGSAQSFYEAGIRLSMEQYGVEADAIAAYLADDTSVPGSQDDPRSTAYDYTRKTDVKIKWNDGDGDEKNLERIITQKWIANYPMGIEAWAEYRRTGYPELAPNIDNLSNGVITDKVRGLRRLRYPYTEKNLNKINYNQAVTLLGGTDNESVDLFWAKKN